MDWCSKNLNIVLEWDERFKAVVGASSQLMMDNVCFCFLSLSLTHT